MKTQNKMNMLGNLSCLKLIGKWFKYKIILKLFTIQLYRFTD